MPKKEKKPVQDISEEENIITPQEFEEIEKKEKKGKIGFLSGKEKPAPKPKKENFFERVARKGDKTDLEDIVLRIEKMEAKMEAGEGLRQATEEKITRISEEIGELRSSILEKERTFNKMESGFDKIKDMFEEVKPAKLRADLDKKEDAIEKLNAKIETFDTKVSDMKKNMADVIGIMDKIKNIKNMVSISETISKKMERIEEDKNDMTKTASKVESMFSELAEKMSEFHNYKDKIEFSSDSMHDLMKAIDMMEVKVENALKKDDMKKIDDRMDQMEADLRDKIEAVRDIVDDLVTSLKKGGVKDLLAKQGKSRIDEINKRLSEINKYEKTVSELKSHLAKYEQDKQTEIKTILSQIESLKRLKPETKRWKEGEADSKQREEIISAIKSQKSKKQEAAPKPSAEESHDAYDCAQTGDINYMMEQCHILIDQGNIEEARRLYGAIVSHYDERKDNPDYHEAEKVYSKIKKLYYRLQIYA